MYSTEPSAAVLGFHTVQLQEGAKEKEKKNHKEPRGPCGIRNARAKESLKDTLNSTPGFSKDGEGVALCLPRSCVVLDWKQS